MIKVTAIITTFNRLPLLKQAVESVLTQSYKNIELIVVDDHSNDGSSEWCKANNITVLQSPYKGGNKARNYGIKHATGDFIAFLDDDDTWDKDKIAKQVLLAEESGNDVIYCGIRKQTKSNNDWSYEDVYPNPINQGNVSRRIFQEIFTVTSALFVKRTLLIEVGLFDEEIEFWQEYELCIRLAQETKFSAVNEILVNYLIDKTDRNRLTNKYYNWKRSVKLIQFKHNRLYSKLTFLEKIYANRVKIWDGLARCENVGLKKQYLVYRMHLKLSFLIEKITRKFSV